MSSNLPTRAELEAELEDDEVFRQKARAHEDDALNTLVSAAKREGDKDDVPGWHTAVNAAKTIIDYSRGRPATQVPTPPERGGLNVSIAIFTGSQQPVEKVVPVERETVDAELVDEIAPQQQLEMGVEITRGKR